MSGIYSITCLTDNKMYIGYALNFTKREEEHFRKLSNNCHKNTHLQAAYNLRGRENFVFEIIEECEKRFLATQEHYWCIMLYTHNKNFGYNIRPTHPYGKTINTPEIREKIRKALTGKVANWGEEYLKSRPIRMRERGWTKEEIEKRAVKKRKSIICLLKDRTFFKRFTCAREVERELGISYKLVSMNCTHKCKTCKGYIFIFEEEYKLININYEKQKVLCS